MYIYNFNLIILFEITVMFILIEGKNLLKNIITLTIYIFIL